MGSRRLTGPTTLYFINSSKFEKILPVVSLIIVYKLKFSNIKYVHFILLHVDGKIGSISKFSIITVHT